MDKRIIKKIKDHNVQFKENICEKLVSDFSGKLNELDIQDLSVLNDYSKPKLISINP